MKLLRQPQRAVVVNVAQSRHLSACHEVLNINVTHCSMYISSLGMCIGLEGFVTSTMAINRTIPGTLL